MLQLPKPMKRISFLPLQSTAYNIGDLYTAQSTLHTEGHEMDKFLLVQPMMCGIQFILDARNAWAVMTKYSVHFKA